MFSTQSSDLNRIQSTYLATRTVTVSGCTGASQVENSPCLNWTTQFLMAVLKVTEYWYLFNLLLDWIPLFWQQAVFWGSLLRYASHFTNKYSGSWLLSCNRPPIIEAWILDSQISCFSNTWLEKWEQTQWAAFLTIRHFFLSTYRCPRRNGQNFGRVFLRLNYTDITQNTYIQSWTVTEIIAREVWNFDSCYTLTDYQIHIKTGRNMWFL